MDFKDLKSMVKTASPEQAELRLEDITFEWVEKGQSLKALKKATQLLEDDGDHYRELKKAILAKMGEAGNQPAQDFKTPQRESREHDKEKAVKEISDWVMVDSPSKEQEKRRQESEMEKNKGNDALRAGDLDEAIEHYRRAVAIDKSICYRFCCSNRS